MWIAAVTVASLARVASADEPATRLKPTLTLAAARKVLAAAAADADGKHAGGAIAVGLPRYHDDRRRVLDFTGVFCFKDGALSVVSKDLSGPNGVALSPDEKLLYVSNWDTKRKVIMRYPVAADCSLGTGEVFFDMTGAPGDEALDGLKVDVAGNVYASGPGGVWIIGPTGTHLGTLVGPELPANFTWGDADGKALYLTARTGVYRIRLGVAGIRP